MDTPRSREDGYARASVRWAVLVAGILITQAASPVAAFDAQVGWSAEQNIAGYRVYVRQSGQAYGTGTDVGLIQPDVDGVVRYVTTGLPVGVVNDFAVTAYDASGRESALSNELSLLVSATPTATSTPASAATGSPTPTGAATASRTATATATRTPTTAASPPPTPSATATPSATPTRTVPRTATATPPPPATSSPNTTSGPTAGGVTIWGPTATPANPADPDTRAVELGVKFTSDVNGLIAGIRFYKSTTNTGTHTASLWSSAGALLATATFTNETASGWQQVNFAAPVAIAANTVYVASYHTDVGHYADDEYYFATAGVDNPPLHALRDGVSGANGVYTYGASAFPTSTYRASNYWVDVVFSTTAPSTATPSPASTATATQTAAATQTATTPPTSAPTRTATYTAVPSATATAARTATAAGTTTPTVTPTATPVAAWSVSIPTNVRAKRNATVSVPVNIAPGSGVRQFALRVAFDPTVVTVKNVQLSTATGGGTLDASFATPGDLTVSATLLQPMTAGGALVNVSFAAVGSCRSSTVLDLVSCVLDGGALGCQPSDGSIAVKCGRSN